MTARTHGELRVAMALAMAMAVMPALAFGQSAERNGNAECVDFCKSVFPPGKQQGECIAQAARGEGPCHEGFCLPAPEGEEVKAKQDYEEKVAALIESTRIPSAFAGSFFRLADSFLSGRAPANELEESAFEILNDMPTATKQVLACAVRRYAALSEADRLTLFGPTFAVPSTEPLDSSTLAQAVATELKQRLSLETFDHVEPSACFDSEVAGFQREARCGVPDPDGGGGMGFCPRICSIGTEALGAEIRTVGFLPDPSPASLLPRELEWVCGIDASGQQKCDRVVQPDCTANTAFFECLAVPNVEAGSNVVLLGYNFSDVDLKVVLDLEGQPPGIPDIVREVEAYVCGDVDHAADAPIDCNVIHDRLTFEVPGDLPTGLYRVGVVVPSGSGALTSDDFAEPIIRVVPPSETRFALTAKEMFCKNETGPDFLGSDEVAMKYEIVSVAPDGPIEPDYQYHRIPADGHFGNVDSGDTEPLETVLFSGSFGALAVALTGKEVDQGDPFAEDRITDFEDAIGKIWDSNWNKLAAELGTLTTTVASTFTRPDIAAAAGGAVYLGTLVSAALWAPADLIMADVDGVSFQGMAELTSLNYPAPASREKELNDINVKTEPCVDTEEEDRRLCDGPAKSAQQYLEWREYKGGDSNYRVRLQYNRLD